MTVGEIAQYIHELAPPETAQEWDNVGLQVGAGDDPARVVLICLEVTEAVIDEAEAVGADLLIAHHPLIFRPLSGLRTDLPVGRLVRRLLCGSIALLVAHTNLDAAPEVGTAAILKRLLDVRGGRPLMPMAENAGLGWVGALSAPSTVGEFAARVREALSPSRLAVIGRRERVVRRVALMPGSGGDAVALAAEAGADVLVCGDLKHHDALDALALGLAVIDAGHYATEQPVVSSLAQYLSLRVGEDAKIIESRVVTDPFADDEC